MEDNILYSEREMLISLSKHNVGIIRKKNKKFLLAQFTSETTYFAIGNETDSLSELFTNMSETMIEVHNALKEKDS